MTDLKEYIIQECHKRFLTRKLHPTPQTDITPLINHLTHLLNQWIRKTHPYYTPTNQTTQTKQKLMKEIWRKIEKQGEISIDEIAETITKIYEENIKPQIKTKLKTQGITILKEYEEINTLLKSKLRYKALKILSKNWASVKQLSEKLNCREEVIRRFLSEMKKLNIITEKAQISNKGRPIKVYKLTTPIIIIDLRRIPQHSLPENPNHSGHS